MDRRSFLTGLFGLAGAAAVGVALAPAAQAAETAPNLLDALQGMDAGKIANPLNDAADLPAEGAQDAQFFYVRRRPVRRYYYRPVVRRRVIVRRPRCVWVRNRFGRVIRRCY